MNDEKSIMKVEAVLPADFDGVFRFTNWTADDFVGIWGGNEYSYPATSTSPMIIPDHSPLEIQHIRKKFAKDLAEREYTKSSHYTNLQKQERNPDGSARLGGIHSAGTYTINELQPYIQRCLEPLTITNATVTTTVKVKMEDKLSRDDEGNLVTEAIDKKASLRAKAAQA